MRQVILAAVLLLFAPAAAGQLPMADYAWPESPDVVAAMESAAEAAPDWIGLHTMGESLEGAPLLIAQITDPDSSVAMADRAITLILTQQHGNEPAGTPAALDLLERIVAGDGISETLQDQILLLWPLANPDGGAAFTRANHAGTDLNRDHVHLEQPESQALHAILNQWDVHVGMDHHEYSGTGTGSPNPVRFYDYDATILHPRHGNVREPTMTWASSLMYDGIYPALEAEGYTAGEYGVQTAAGTPVSHIAGGPDPGILRNNFGLNNVAGLLVESFVATLPNPLVDAEHRIDVHATVMDATLEYVHANADAIMQAKAESQRLNLEEPMDEYIEEWPDDPVTGQANTGNIRGPLAPAYATNDDLSALMGHHGLPLGIPTADGTAHSLHHERAGLLAAILAPDSSRQVPSDVTAMDVAPVMAEAGPEADDSEDSPAMPVVLVALALVGVALLRRQS